MWLMSDAIVPKQQIPTGVDKLPEGKVQLPVFEGLRSELYRLSDKLDAEGNQMTVFEELRKTYANIGPIVLSTTVRSKYATEHNLAQLVRGEDNMVLTLAIEVNEGDVDARRAVETYQDLWGIKPLLTACVQIVYADQVYAEHLAA